jgi:acyl-coenzyme A synthetase/AMP-(fatty) acid ligase
VLATLDEHRDDTNTLYVGPDGALTWRELAIRSETASRALVAAGLSGGDRVSVLVPPGRELLVAALAIWRAGGVPVVADASAGVGQLRRLVRAAAPRFVVGTPRTLAAAAVLGMAPGARRAGFVASKGVVDLRRAQPDPAATTTARSVGEVAAVVHTSGSTGPAKPVRYTHEALSALRPALQSLGLSPGGVFTTSFGPFMLLAPVLGMTCVRPDFEVDQPAKLGFDELRGALAMAPVSAAWLSPAAARQIVATARGRRVALDLVMLAGAPIAPALAHSVAMVTGAEVRTPYGMTECLPVTDGTDFDATGSLGGYSTGAAVPGCRVRIAALDDATREVPDGAGWGELLVSAPWMFDGYDGDWRGTRRSEQWVDGVRFHRTGDVGYLEGGRLFHLGRLAHVLNTAGGPLASVAVEGPIAAHLGRDVAAVGVGPKGAEVVCIVVHEHGALSLSDESTAERVREGSAHRVGAVLSGSLPLDHRHQSKVDRTTLQAGVAAYLAGR